MRTTKAEVIGMFKRLLRATYTDHYNGSLKQAGWTLDYNECYGGYVVVAYDKDGVMEISPLGLARRKTREMYLSLCMACEAVELVNKKHEDFKRG